MFTSGAQAVLQTHQILATKKIDLKTINTVQFFWTVLTTPISSHVHYPEVQILPNIRDAQHRINKGWRLPTSGHSPCFFLMMGILLSPGTESRLIKHFYPTASVRTEKTSESFSK